MNAIRETLANFGTAWNNEVPSGLMKLYEPLQAQQNAKYSNEIKAEKALKYGSDPRHRIDVYQPASGASGRPVVVFFHGGGYVTGDTDTTPNVYSNVGNYFTKQGCITCLATYRLGGGKGGHWPDGAQDVSAALRWVQTNISKYGGDPDKVIAVGQSAGGTHLATAMFMGFLDAQGHAKSPLSGAVFLSAAFSSSTEVPERVPVLKDWFNTENVFEINSRWSPAAIFRQQYFGTVTVSPRESLPCEILMMIGDYEATEILDGTWEFVHDYRKRFGRLPSLEVMKGHNHVSYIFGLGLDDPDYHKVGQRIVSFIKERTAQGSGF